MFRPRPSLHMSLIPLFFLFLTLTVSVYAQADTPKIEQEVIGTLPTAMVDGTLVFSGYSAHYAFVTGSTGKQTVVLDGTPQDRSFKQIGRIRFAPNTYRLFYWALDSSGGKETIVLVADRTVIETDFTGEGSLIFSDDGTQWVIIRGESNGVTVMLNGKKLGVYADATWPRFSPDGKHVAFLVKDKVGKISVMIDGKAERSFESPSDKFSMDFMSSVNGPNMPPLHVLEYMADGSLLILTLDKPGWTVYNDEKELASYPNNIWGGGDYQIINFEGFDTAKSILAYSLTYSSEGNVAVWWERQEGDKPEWHVVRNGKAVDEVICSDFWPYDTVSLSDNGEHFGYPCVVDEKGQTHYLVVTDGEKHGPYANVWGVTVSNDGAHSAYMALAEGEESSWQYYLDGKPFDLQYDSGYSPRFSNDGTHLLWKATRGEDANLEFFISLDGQEITTTKSITWGPIFDEAGDVIWIEKKGTEIIRFKVGV